MGLKDQIKTADSVSEVNRLLQVGKRFYNASDKTIRQILREGDRAIARLNTPKTTQQKAKELVEKGQAVSMSEAKRRVIQMENRPEALKK